MSFPVQVSLCSLPIAAACALVRATLSSRFDTHSTSTIGMHLNWILVSCLLVLLSVGLTTRTVDAGKKSKKDNEEEEDSRSTDSDSDDDDTDDADKKGREPHPSSSRHTRDFVLTERFFVVCAFASASLGVLFFLFRLVVSQSCSSHANELRFFSPTMNVTDE